MTPHTTDTADTTEMVCMGKILRPHGIGGLLRVASYTTHPSDITAYGALTCPGNGKLTLIHVADTGGGKALLMRATECRNRNDAEALKGKYLYLERAALPPAKGDEFYVADLLGLEVRDENGASIGHVKRVENHGAGDILVVRHQNGLERDIPFTRSLVPEVLLAPQGGGVVVIAARAGA